MVAEGSQAPPAADDAVQMTVVLRVIRAELRKSFDSFGKMDPFAVVEWKPAAGSAVEVSHTRTHWNGHMNPQWDHTCRGQPYAGRGAGDNVEFKVLEANVTTKATFCGSAAILVDSLLDLDAQGSQPDGIIGPVRQLPLLNKGSEIGSVTVQALLVPREGSVAAGEALSRAAADMFEVPVRRIGVSGGTAPFFRLLLRQPKDGRSGEYYIGKDLSHAADEINFYEEARAIRQLSSSSGLAGLLDFTFEYAGIFTCPVEAAAGKVQLTKELLVMRNLRDGCAKLRLLDLKIGQKTAQAGWQGKSRLAALRQGLVDGMTNSSFEGYRLEGFDGCPPVLDSMDPLLDVGGSGNPKVAKKALRIMLQRMNACEVLMHFLDVHQEPADPGEFALVHTYSPCEVAEMVLHEVLTRLVQLTLACRRSPVPHKWIGSSVALGFDGGRVPSRATPQAEVRKAAQVNIFDWGRSELNTLDKYQNMSDKEQHDRAEFWGYYVGGVDRLSWEVARAYWHRFGNAGTWKEVTFTIYDFDSASENDFIGRLTVPLLHTPETTQVLRNKSGGLMSRATRSSATVTYSISWRPYPDGSRMRGSWRIHIVRAAKLPSADFFLISSKSDPFCELTAVSADGNFRFRQSTCVRVKTLDPEWNETFDIPVASSTKELQVALNSAAPGLGNTSLEDLMPPEILKGWSTEVIRSPDEALAHWRARLDNYRHRVVSRVDAGPEVEDVLREAEEVPSGESPSVLAGLASPREEPLLFSDEGTSAERERTATDLLSMKLMVVQPLVAVVEHADSPKCKDRCAAGDCRCM